MFPSWITKSPSHSPSRVLKANPGHWFHRHQISAKYPKHWFLFWFVAKGWYWYRAYWVLFSLRSWSSSGGYSCSLQTSLGFVEMPRIVHRWIRSMGASTVRQCIDGNTQQHPCRETREATSSCIASVCWLRSGSLSFFQFGGRSGNQRLARVYSRGIPMILMATLWATKLPLSRPPLALCRE